MRPLALPPALFHVWNQIFYSQEPKTDKDEEFCRKVNEYLNNPPIPGALGSGGGGHELSALGGKGWQGTVKTVLKTPNHTFCYVSLPGEGGLQNLLGNMSHNQLMQLIGPTGLGGIGMATVDRVEQHWSAQEINAGFLVV